MRLFSRFTPNIVAASLSLALGLLAHSAQAIVVYGDQGRNTSAPTGDYADSGWQYAAFAGGYNLNNEFIINTTVWPVAPNWVLRATHTSAQSNIGESIYQDGVAHTVQEIVPIYDSQGRPTDLTLQRVDTSFARYAPMYQGSNELGKDLIVYGSGTNIKGSVITAEGSTQPAGWTIADNDGSITGANQFSWGLNQVANTVDVTIGDSVTNTLYSTFDRPTLDDGSANPASAGANEGTAGFGDSSGGVFIKNNGQWQLAGLVYAIDGGIYYNQTSNSPNLGFLYDYRGFYVDNGHGGRDYVTGSDPVGAGFYASRVSAYQSQINAVIVPEGGTAALFLTGTATLGIFITRKRRRKSN